MKRICGVLLALLFCCSGCNAPAPKKAAETELIIFAAASLTETMTEIAERYTAEHPDLSIVFNFDSSGTLKTQIEEGADCDLFLSAGQKQMDALASANLLLLGSRTDLLENRVVLCVPDGNPKGVDGFDTLAARLKEGDILFAMGNSDVPVGQYTQKILTFYGLDEAALAASGTITYGSNAKEVTTQIAEASVDCGVVYATDAASAELTVIDSASTEMCGQVIYPAAVIGTSAHIDAAQAFLNHLKGESAMAVFQAVGFAPVR